MGRTSSGLSDAKALLDQAVKTRLGLTLASGFLPVVVSSAASSLLLAEQGSTRGR